MDVDITIPAEESQRILRLMTVLGHEFPDVKQGLLSSPKTLSPKYFLM